MNNFGTGGIRAIMGPNPDQLNVETIGKIGQGLANYLKKYKKPTVVIGYDCRHNSPIFAATIARVLAGNGIEVRIFNERRPTPLLSFACRHYKTKAAVMVTASHNPREYNGIKIYGPTGGQVTTEDKKISLEIANVKKIEIAPLDHLLISWITNELDPLYIAATKTLIQHPELPRNLRILYSNLHGTGITLLPFCLQAWGFSPIFFVEKQKKMDGSFPYAPLPNPEEPSALVLGTQKLLKEKMDLFLATDPDADRVGVVIRHKGKAIHLNGNQVGALLLHYLLHLGKKVPPSATCIKTLVTTDLLEEIAKGYPFFTVFTGFKHIAKKMGSCDFFFGAEESCGYLAGRFVQDKDGISASCLIAEMALYAKTHNKTLYDLLLSLYKQHGVFREKLVTLPVSNHPFRDHFPKNIAGKKVVASEDFLPQTDLLRLTLENGSKIVIRPSGTEAKMKVYLSAKKKYSPFAIKELDRHLDSLQKAVEKLCCAISR